MRRKTSYRPGLGRPALRSLVTLAAVLGWLAQPAFGQDLLQKVNISGFASWGFGNSDTNPYLTAPGDGHNEFDNVDFSLNLAAEPIDRLRITAQVHFESSDEGDETELEFASATWTFSDQLRFRAGRATLPFGIYTEIFDVGTLRPFFSLPQSLYGPAGFLAENYTGVGILGSFEKDSGWSISYDLYAGAMTLELERAFAEAIEGPGAHEGQEEEGEAEHLENILGTKLVFSTPVDGLSFGFSFFAGEPEGEEAGPDHPTFGDHISYTLQAEHLAGPWSIRSEWGRHQGRHGLKLDIDIFYLELGYRLSSKWQLAGRYESAEVELKEVELDPVARSLLDHDELALGVNYWFGPNFVLKLSFHSVDGNLFAHPESDELFEALAAGGLEESTDLVLFGAQFSF